MAASARGYTAIVRVTGSDGRLEEVRERVRWLLVRDPDCDPYTEHHAADRLEYRFELTKGIPIPAFATASAEHPGLRVELEWDKEGATGGAVLENGRLADRWTGERKNI